MGYQDRRNAQYSDIALGVDPGLASCGFAVVAVDRQGQLHVLETAVQQTTRQITRYHTKVCDDDNRRLADIQKATVTLLAAHAPSAVGIETYVPLMNRQGNGAYKVGMVYGLIYGLSLSANRPVYPFTPQDLRRYCLHSAQGTKLDIDAAICRLIANADEKLSIYPKTRREHAADAIGHAMLAITHHKLHAKLTRSMPKHTS